MGKMLITEDCLSPERFLYLTYTGPNPWGVVKKISDTIKPFLHISTSSTNWDRLNWDISGDPITFYSTWWAKKGMGLSTMRINIKVQGTKSKTDNTGRFWMELTAKMETTFSGPSFLLKPAWLMYSYLFYNKIRRKNIEKCRDYMVNFRNEIKEYFNLEVTAAPGAHTAMD